MFRSTSLSLASVILLAPAACWAEDDVTNRELIRELYPDWPGVYVGERQGPVIHRASRVAPSFWAGIQLGAGFGSTVFDLDSVATEVGTGTRSSDTISDTETGADNGPALSVRCGLCFNAVDWKPLLALQLTTDSPDGAEYTGRGFAIEGLFGARWRLAPGRHWLGFIGLGYVMRDADWDGAVVNGAGVVLDTYSASADLGGSILRMETGPEWQMSGIWHVSVAGGLTWQHLLGDARWDSDAGLYTGKDDLSADIFSLYGQVGINAWW